MLDFLKSSCPFFLPVIVPCLLHRNRKVLWRGENVSKINRECLFEWDSHVRVCSTPLINKSHSVDVSLFLVVAWNVYAILDKWKFCYTEAGRQTNRRRQTPSWINQWHEGIGKSSMAARAQQIQKRGGQKRNFWGLPTHWFERLHLRPSRPAHDKTTALD